MLLVQLDRVFDLSVLHIRKTVGRTEYHVLIRYEKELLRCRYMRR